MIAAPIASVQEPKTADRVRQTERVRNFVAIADPTTERKKPRDATTKTGRLPKTCDSGTHQKFFWSISVEWLSNLTVVGTYPETRKQHRVGYELSYLAWADLKLDAEPEESG